MLFTSLLSTTVNLVRFLLRFLLFLVRMWLLKACFRFILPLPVNLKRFFAPETVFILGMAFFFIKLFSVG